MPLDRRCFLACLRTLAAGCALVLAAASVRAQGVPAAFDHSHARWSDVLRGCVRDGALDYAKLKGDRAEFDAYLAALHAVTPELLAGWNDKQRLAFWINVYNAHCVARALDAYPLKSIRRLDGGFGLNTAFDQAFIPMRALHPAGKDADLSLNDVQDRILRKRFRDARVLAALHNSAKSAPPLRAEAYTADALDAQLDQQMRAFLDDATKNKIDPAAKELALSEVFKWFAEDFERDGKSLQEFLIRFASKDKADFIRAAPVRFLAYDWSLADASKK